MLTKLETPFGDRSYFFNRFESMTEFADEVIAHDKYIQRDRGPGSHGIWVPGSSSYDRDWVGRHFKSWQDLMTTGIGGYWIQGMATYERMISKLRELHIPPPASLKRELTWNEDDGFELDLDRLQRDRPPWRTTRRHHRPGPVSYTIVTDITTSAAYDANEVLWRGAAAIALTELLEQSGYRVELWVAQHCTNTYMSKSGTGQCTAVRLKMGTDPLDVSTLISCVSSWCYRTLFFGAYWIGGERPNDGLGTITPISQILKNITPDQNAKIVENIYAEHSAIQFVMNKLKELETK